MDTLHAPLMPLALDTGPSTAPRARDAAPPSAGLSRRRFLGSVSAGTGGLVMTFALPLTPRTAQAGMASGAASAGTDVGVWVSVAADETITVRVGATDMGQGVWTALPQILADEMQADWSRVRAEAAPAGAAWGNPLFGYAQFTGGSTAVRGYHDALRTAGAALREMFVSAAAATWGVPVSQCTARNGRVLHNDTGDALTYGQLAPAAALQAVPASPAWTADAQLRLIGRSVARTDVPAKVDGSAVFGMDVRLPGMLYAAIVHSPKQGGVLKGTPAKPAGALAVVALGNAVAVVAKDTWTAFKAADALRANWTVPATARDIDSTVIRNQANTLMASGTALVAEQDGDVNAALAVSAQRVDLKFSLPYLAHACMEVLNATASVTATSCEIWAPTQGQTNCVFAAQAATGLTPEQITVHTTFLGGGLGRKYDVDFVTQAILVSKAVGAPVKLTWTREQDFANDRYRPMALVRVRAGLDAAGAVSAFSVRNVSPSISAQRFPLVGPDPSAVEGAVLLPYAFATRQTEWVQHPAAVPLGYWRSVGNSINAFVVESAVDALARAAGADPYDFRRTLLAAKPRELAVLDAAAALGGWRTPVPAGRARGIAFCASFGSLCAQVVEVSKDARGKIVVNKVAVAIDCGRAINPKIVTAQMQSGVVHALSATLWGRMQFANGEATVKNFNHARVLRMAEMPVISVAIVNSGEALGGVGEPGVPPLAPAVASAWARLTGQRVRELPMFPGDANMGEVG